MSRIIYTAGLLMTGSDDVTVGRDLIVNRHISGSGELFFSASNGNPELRVLMYDTGSGKVFMSSSLADISVAGNPAGSNTQIQFNNGGGFGASSNLTFNGGTLTVTGDINVTGDLSAKGPNRSIQFNDAGNLSGSSVLGFNKTNDTLEMTGSTILLASEASALSMEMNESASFEFLTGAANSGSFIVQTSPDTGKGALQSYFGQGTGTVFGQPLPNQTFGIKYTSGSSASEGELTMVIGKRDLTNLGGANQNNFYVAYEPGGTFTNAQGELEFFVGEHLNVGSGVLSVFRGGASAVTQTSSFAGYFSSSAFANQQRHTRPFALSTSASVDDTNPAFVINKDHTDLTSDNLLIDYGGTIKTDGRLIFRSDITNEISASGRLNITTTGDQIALKADGGNIVRILDKDNTEVFGAKSASAAGEPGTVLRNIASSFLYAKDGVANVFVTSSLFAASALATETLDYRGNAMAEVGAAVGTPAKGTIVALTGSKWSVANSGSGACASSSLAIALTGGSQGPQPHFLLDGIVNLPYTPGDRVGQLLYLGDKGSASAVPPSNPAHFSIPVGYYLGGTTMYFSPDRTTGGADNVSATTNTPAGSDTQIQFNDNGAFGASSALTFDDGALSLTGNFTASGNISASNASFKDSITIRETSGNGIKFSDNLDKIYFDGTNIVIAIDDEDKYTFRPGGLDLLGHITASGNISASGVLSISSSENPGQPTYRVLVQDISTGRVYHTGSYFDTSPYEVGSMAGDIQPKRGNNIASGSFATIGGGQDNRALGINSFIAGGSGSIAKGTGNVVLGGHLNSISGSTFFSVVAGNGNVIDVSNGSSNIVSGISNTLTGIVTNGVVMTGDSNSSVSKGSVIFGKNNTISGEAHYYHVAGVNNTISGTETLADNPGSIMGGGSNTLGPNPIGQGQIIVGGKSNSIAGYTGNSIILQGQDNEIDDSVQPTQQSNQTFLSILNGKSNEITGSAPTTSAAKDSSGKFSTIVNGESNKIETGGAATQTVYKYNTIMNGVNNTVSGSGSTAGVSGLYNTIVNGSGNVIMPDISGSTIAAGSNITADRSDTVYAANLSLTNLPTSAAGLPVGAVYRSGDTLKIVT